MIRGASARKCGQNIRNARVVAKRLADMREAVDIAGGKNEACSELEGTFAKFMLTVFHFDARATARRARGKTLSRNDAER
jgi:hypothetical protein